MIRLFDWIKLGVTFGAGLLAGGLVFYSIGHRQGVDDGYDQRIAETAAATAKAELERKGDDALLQSMPDYDLCLAGLRAGGVSDTSPCEQLRGLDEE